MGNSCLAGRNGFVQSVSNAIFGTKTLPSANADDNSSNSNADSPETGLLSKSKKKSKDEVSEADDSVQTTPPAQVKIDQGESPKKRARKEVKQKETIPAMTEVKQEESKPKAKVKQEDSKPTKQKESKSFKPEVKQEESKSPKPEKESKSPKPEKENKSPKPEKEIKSPKHEVKQEVSKSPKREKESKSPKPEVKQEGSKSPKQEKEIKSPKLEVKKEESKSPKLEKESEHYKPEVRQRESKPSKPEVKQEESKPDKVEEVKQEESKSTNLEIKQGESKPSKSEVQQVKPGESKSPKSEVKEEASKPVKTGVKQEESKDTKPEVKQGESKPSQQEVKQEANKHVKADVKQEESKATKSEVEQGESKPHKLEVMQEVKQWENKIKAEVQHEANKPVRAEFKPEESKATKPEAKQGEIKPSKPEVKEETGKTVKTEGKQEESKATKTEEQGEIKPFNSEVQQEASKPEIKQESMATKPDVKQEEGKHVKIDVKQEESKPATTGPLKSKKHMRRVSSVGLQVDSVLQRKSGNLKDDYTVGRKLGEGQFGTTHFCLDKKTGREVACKSIAKRKLITKEDVEDVRREIQIMHHLAGHPNVISIVAAYEDAVAVYMVMELCAGGELFDRIVQRGHYSERKAAELARVIVGVVEACHSLGVMHRDLKPENFLFVNEEEDAPLKTIDFGLSVFFKPGDTFTDVVGSPYYVAPEVLRKFYGQECDVWSAGVIIYILLSGVPPFWDEHEHGIFEQVLRGELDFDSEPWPSISEDAKDLVKKMLVRDPKKRLTAHEVLRHPWVKVHGVAPDKPLDSAVLSRLKQFSAMHKLKKIAIKIIAERLSEDEIAGLKQMFKMIDSDNSGHITLEELQIGLERVGANLMEGEISNLMEAADLDNSGTIDYTEFVAAMLHQNKMMKEDHLFAAFSYFDKDGSGYITPDELQEVCKQFGLGDVHLEEIMNEVDQDKDGRIDYNEFVDMMQNTDFGKKGLQNSLSIGSKDAFKGGST